MTVICVDIGNTRTKVGVFLETEAPLYFTYPLLTLLELDTWRQQWPDAMVIISSTTTLSEPLLEALRDFGGLIQLSHQLKLPFKNAYRTPETLGLDRIALVAAAVSLYEAQDILVIDAGTCITLDFVDRHGVYHGGSIHPGILMRLKAMHQFTGRLPLVGAESPSFMMGNDTVSCIQVGAIMAAVVEVDAFVSMYKSRYPRCKVLLTGGDAELFFSKLKNEIFAHPNLVLRGLLEIAKNNV
jgi:type III pantothenate kinase